MDKFGTCSIIFRIVCSLVLLLSASLGVLAQRSQIDQKPLEASSAFQPASPVQISIGGVDNSESSFQSINVVIQNVSSKPIWAYVVAVEGPIGSGKSVSSHFSSPFLSGQLRNDSVAEERMNIRTDSTVVLTVDYVRFVDGTSWGPDKRQQAYRISGELEGREFGINELKKAALASDSDELIRLLNREIPSLEPPSIDASKSELWQRGFKAGYKMTFSKFTRVLELDGLVGLRKGLEDRAEVIKK